MVLMRRNHRDSAWDPLRELETLQSEMSRLFDFSLSRWPEKTWNPAVDIHDTKDNLIVKVDIPGLSKDEIEVTVENGALVIKGEKKREEKSEEEGLIREERYYGTFYRSIQLPTSVDADKVKAASKNGVMTITVPKITSSALSQKQSTKITVS